MVPSFRQFSATPSCQRIRQRFDTIAVGDAASDVGHLVLAVLLEESLGGRCLQNLGMTLTRIADGCFGDVVAKTSRTLPQAHSVSDPTEAPIAAIEIGLPSNADDEVWLTELFDRARSLARRAYDAATPETTVGSTHLVQAMVELQGPAKTQLAELGITLEDVEAELSGGLAVPNSILKVDLELAPEVFAADEAFPDHEWRGGNEPEVDTPVCQSEFQHRVLTVLDANLNRTREGLRVLEDYARFIARDAVVTEELKRMRHQLVAAETLLRSGGDNLLQQRAVEHDVGTGITTEQELRRESVGDVVAANARRVQEALRSLEEFGKTICGEFAAAIKQLRYQSYSLEQRLRVDMADNAAELGESFEALQKAQPKVLTTFTTDGGSATSLRADRLTRLQEAFVYVLLTEELCRTDWQETARAALAGGADVIQLREKQLADDELISRGQWLAAACESAGALFILNDRSDLAIAAGAHGVHVGQEDGSVAVARAMLNSDQLLGVSTHDVAQVQSACADGADYLGVGPVFPSATKQFDGFPGIEFVKKAAEASSVPWFAIGGINIDTVALVRLSGARRIAVSNAVIGSGNPESAVRSLRDTITADDTDSPASLKFNRG